MRYSEPDPTADREEIARLCSHLFEIWTGAGGEEKTRRQELQTAADILQQTWRASMADSFSLPPDHRCYSTLEAFKNTVDLHLKAYLQAVQYQEYGGRLEQWRQCCPGSVGDVERVRPAQPDPEPLRTITLPADLYNPDGACKEHLYFGGPAAPDSLGKAWFQHREKYWEQEWIRIYFILSNELHSCCIRQFNECQRKVLYGAPGPTPEQVALEACVRQFSPEHQPRIALQGAPAAARTAEVERQSLEQQYGVCRKERSQCQTRLNELEKGQRSGSGPWQARP